VMKTTSAMVASMVLLRKTPEANEYGVLMAIFPALSAAGRVEREPKTVFVSSSSLRHCRKGWSCSRWRGSGHRSCRWRRRFSHPWCWRRCSGRCERGFRSGGAPHTHRVAVSFEEGFRPVRDFQDLFLLGEAVFVVDRARVRAPVARIEDHLTGAVGVRDYVFHYPWIPAFAGIHAAEEPGM
jgi:hypothetical protein